MGAQKRERERELSPAPSRSHGPSVQRCSILPTIGAGRGARAGRMVVRREEGGGGARRWRHGMRRVDAERGKAGTARDEG